MRFGNGKKGYVVGIGKVSKSHSADKGNKGKFTLLYAWSQTIILETWFLTEKRDKKIYKANIMYTPEKVLTCISEQHDDSILWHNKIRTCEFLSLE